jgi:fatty acid desaturase
MNAAAPHLSSATATRAVEFASALKSLRAEIDATTGPQDFAHFLKLERWGRVCTLLGYATAWLAPNPVSALLLALGSTVRWTLVMHHVSHSAYDRIPGIPKRYTGAAFATGWRRYVDWLDWLHPGAWRHEHNVLHHYHTGEVEDPDQIEENLQWLRRSPWPLCLKYVVIAFFACTWKLTYYAPSTYKAWQQALWRRSGQHKEAPPARHHAAFNPFTAYGRAFLADCVLPYASVRFGLVLLPFLLLGKWAVLSVLVNSVLAELLSNVYSFFLITPNHAGDDLHRFSGHPEGRAEFYLRQVKGSANYRAGHDVIDFLHGGLNYQIEHHLFPNLPLLKYQQYQPRVKALCVRYGIPYIQESVLLRSRKLLHIITGCSSMLHDQTPRETGP